MNERDQDRLELLDRIAERVPGLDLDQHEIEWTTLPDGHEVLLVDGWSGAYFANHGDDLHAYGTGGPDRPRPRRLLRDPPGREPLPRPRGARPAGGVAAGRRRYDHRFPARPRINCYPAARTEEWELGRPRRVCARPRKEGRHDAKDSYRSGDGGGRCRTHR